jgi:hypothetical protein
MALVARTGSFNTLHRALRLVSRGRVFPVSQKYMHGPVTPTRSASCTTDRPRLIRASRIWRAKLGLRGNGEFSLLSTHSTAGP